ncbi:hypothetical protein M0802_003987 [Mischocyttarus mexicanus]|nr:hypothetical protein M0802_003987 [Mischocyttarus mexicanus]
MFYAVELGHLENQRSFCFLAGSKWQWKLQKLKQERQGQLHESALVGKPAPPLLLRWPPNNELRLYSIFFFNKQ